MTPVEGTDPVSDAVLGLAVAGITHPGMLGWLTTPNATFGGRTPALAYGNHPALVEDIARLAERHGFRRGR